jgi:hypothetical protein
VDGHVTALLDDPVDRRRQRRHVIPVPVGDRNRFDFTQRYSERGAVTDEDRAFGTRIEQQRVARVADGRDQSQPEAEIGAQQRFAGQHTRSAADHIAELRDRERRLADVVVADVVGQHRDAEGIQRLQSLSDRGRVGHCSVRVRARAGAMRVTGVRVPAAS